MEAAGVCVYLKFGAIADEQRTAVLERLGSSLSPDMTLSEQFGHPFVWVEGPSDDAADIAAQVRLKAIRAELGLTEDQVRTTLDPNRLSAVTRSAEELRRWAHEHLVYEAKMLVHDVERVADASLSDPDRNAFIESFAIHVRCLRDFVWRDSRPKNLLSTRIA